MESISELYCGGEDVSSRYNEHAPTFFCNALKLEISMLIRSAREKGPIVKHVGAKREYTFGIVRTTRLVL